LALRDAAAAIERNRLALSHVVAITTLLDLTTERQQQLLEVWGFDLLADVEAMLRHARQNQRTTVNNQ
jgi:hypothetical protein